MCDVWALVLTRYSANTARYKNWKQEVRYKKLHQARIQDDGRGKKASFQKYLSNYSLIEKQLPGEIVFPDATVRINQVTTKIIHILWAYDNV